jgi:hypothetical protein
MRSSDAPFGLFIFALGIIAITYSLFFYTPSENVVKIGDSYQLKDR